MPKFIVFCSYSTGSWARMMRSIDDRVAMAGKLTECLGGSLECVYWEVSTRAVYAIADMPDSTCAAAAAVLTHTGAFKSEETHELLTQDQLCGAHAGRGRREGLPGARATTARRRHDHGRLSVARSCSRQ